VLPGWQPPRSDVDVDALSAPQPLPRSDSAGGVVKRPCGADLDSDRNVKRVRGSNTSAALSGLVDQDLPIQVSRVMDDDSGASELRSVRDKASDGVATRDATDHEDVKMAGIASSDLPPPVPLLVSAGTAVVFSSTLWHRSSPNLSDRIRRAYYAQFSAAPITAQLTTNVAASDQGSVPSLQSAGHRSESQAVEPVTVPADAKGSYGTSSQRFALVQQPIAFAVPAIAR